MKQFNFLLCCSLFFVLPHLSLAATTTPDVQDKANDSSFQKALQKEQDNKTLSPSMEQLSPGSAGAVVPQEELSVDKAKAKNSYTVGECFENAQKLDNNKIVVRGKVMKVSKQIMGKNWVHIQDGTGYAMSSTHDLVITTQAEPETGSIVTFNGTLHANRDFGFGYKYAAIVEDATLQQ